MSFIEKIWPTLKYGEEADANEFYIGLIENLVQNLPEKYAKRDNNNNCSVEPKGNN